MAAASYQHQTHSYRPLKILNRDDDSFMRFKSQIIAKRKSAVELLQETKPLYVKSEIVLDRKQELRRSLRANQLPNEEEIKNCYSSSSVHSTKSNNSSTFNHSYTGYNNHSPTDDGTSTVPLPLPKSPRLILPPPAFRKSTNSLQLQNKLRKLLNTDSKENLLEANSVIDKDDGNNTVESKTAEFYNNSYSNQINSICHKSLPDLTNVRDLSPSLEKSDHASYGFTSCSINSDGICKKSTHTDCVSWASCKNDYLYASANYCESQNDLNLEEETSVDNQPADTFLSSPVKSCSSYITPPPLYCDTKELSKNRAVSRSKSDVGARTLSSLQLADIPLYDSSNLNLFFDNLGLESNEYNLLTAPRSNSSSPIYFDSDSSVVSIGECASGGENPSTNHAAELPSIVERNARIIKWLCNCRKAIEQMPRFIVPQSR